jgi:dynein heavy chain
MERIEKQMGLLEKEKERFIKQMDNNKADFSLRIMELDNLVTGFAQYQDSEQYEQVAQMAKDIKARTDEESNYAKMINNNENLIGVEEISDYSHIANMVKQFKPFYDLWTTVETWKTSHTSWLNDPFDDLDPKAVEDTVDNANKTLASVIRSFRDKDVPNLLNIANDIKGAVDEFRE